MSNFVRVLQAAELPAGSKKAVEVAGKWILLCNTDNRLFAVSNICSHAEEKLDCGRMGRTWIACPLHGARFELATGRAMNPPATKPIATYEVRTVDGWIEVGILPVGQASA
ncbi:MAG TPA: non-heme iron oxygenase ferredoxin subunit [Povalibacter sp.]|uniref:Rieske (2Fe-2S) protein n=1 Tax=Povalibacter sp. TaxID=1962978 RepID=UPI002D0F612E|nr:non-heme iron oxygenase ferredoxin subunit [Povalibacter sp.]HMN43655.1 non-heme iron oxygenase ferredoxin subunit [Povalibacter sp.]